MACCGFDRSGDRYFGRSSRQRLVRLRSTDPSATRHTKRAPVCCSRSPLTDAAAKPHAEARSGEQSPINRPPGHWMADTFTC
jgi:hypothetical protein